MDSPKKFIGKEVFNAAREANLLGWEGISNLERELAWKVLYQQL
jgi:hypothetical protein